MLRVYISACNNGGYIKNKTCVPCQGHCKNSEPCNKLTGQCDHGCRNNWTGEFCEGVYAASLFFIIINLAIKVFEKKRLNTYFLSTDKLKNEKNCTFKKCTISIPFFYY